LQVPTEISGSQACPEIQRPQKPTLFLHWFNRAYCVCTKLRQVAHIIATTSNLTDLFLTENEQAALSVPIPVQQKTAKKPRQKVALQLKTLLSLRQGQKKTNTNLIH
jgi:hypothetical protein